MEGAGLLLWLLLLGSPGPPTHPTASVERVFGNFTKDLIQVFHGYLKQDLCFPRNSAEYLPDAFRPSPDLYGIPQKPVIIAAYVGIALFVIFIWKCILPVKPQIYQVTLQQILLKTKNCIEENNKILEKVSYWEKKINESNKCIQEMKWNSNILSDEINKFKVNLKTLKGENEMLGDILERTRATLQSERLHNASNQDLILKQEKIVETLKGFILKTTSDVPEVKNVFHEARIIEEKAMAEEEKMWKENAQLKAKEKQFQQESECRRKEHSDLQEQIIALENIQKDLEGALSGKDNTIAALADCTSQLSGVFGSASEDKHMGPSEELAGGMNTKKKFQVLEMTDVSQAKTAIAAAEDDLKRLKLELSTSMSTKHKLQEYKKELEDDCNLLKFEKAAKEAECKTLRLKVEILEEIFEQQRTAAEEKLELKMHKRQECQMWLSEEEEKMNMAAEEVMNYMQRIEEMELKLQQTESLYVQQISFYEVMAHNSWLRAHALERELIEQIRQVAELKHRLEITQSKKPQEEGDIKTLKPVKPDVEDFPQRDETAMECSEVTDLKDTSNSFHDPLPPPLFSSRPRTRLKSQQTPKDPGPGAAPSRKSSSGSSFPAKGASKLHPRRLRVTPVPACHV